MIERDKNSIKEHTQIWIDMDKTKTENVLLKLAFRIISPGLAYIYGSIKV